MSKVTVYFINHEGLLNAKTGTVGYRQSPELQFAHVIFGLVNNHYVYVAQIEAHDLEDAWRKTNHIDAPWYEGSHVVDFKDMPGFDGGARSGMVGDVYVYNNKAYMCAAAGWTMLPEAVDVAKMFEERLQTNDR